MIDDLVGKKTRILAEKQQFESGLSSNIFRCGNTKVRGYITQTWLTDISEEIHSFGISREIQMLLPESPTIMDVAITTHLSITQLQSLNRARLHTKKMHLNNNLYKDADWTVRQCQQHDFDILDSFLSQLQPTTLQERLPVYHSFQTPLKKSVVPPRAGKTLRIAYDGSYNDRISQNVL